VALFLLVLIGIAVSVVLAGGKGWLGDSAAEWLAMPEMIQPRVEVRSATVTVETGRAGDATVVATGYLESRRQAKIGARAPGRIEVIHVEEGSRVEADQVVAVLEHADLDASLSAAEAALERAKAELVEQKVAIDQAKVERDRAEELLKTKSISESLYDEARFRHDGAIARETSLKAAISLADARVREAQQMKANMFIRAPFRGTVISKDAEVGESILPGGMGEASGRGSVLTVADLDQMDVECDVKEDYIGRVIVGHPAEVAVDAVPERRYQGRVWKVIPMGDRARATIKVKVEIIDVDARLFPEMSATVFFLPEKESTEDVVPQRRVFCETDAIREDKDGHHVLIVDDSNRTRRQPVTVGAARDRRTEIIEGLSGDENVVIAPPGVFEGTLVRMAP
jgi:RND family efflux transporter MFP subunit